MKTKLFTYDDLRGMHPAIHDYWDEAAREREAGVTDSKLCGKYNIEELDHMISALNADRHELCRRMYPGFKRIWQWVRPANPYPGDQWQDEFDIIVANFMKWMPGFFCADEYTPAQLREQQGVTDVGRAQKWLQEVGMIVIDRLDCRNVMAVKKEMEQRGGENVVNVEEVIAELEVDLVTAEELEPLLPDVNVKQIGRILGGLGCERIRMAHSGQEQWVWAIDNVEKYKAMKPREVKEIWLNQGSNDSVSFM